MVFNKDAEEDIVVATVTTDEAIPIGIATPAVTAAANARPNYFMHPTEDMLAQAKCTHMGGILFINLSGPKNGKFVVPKTIRAGTVLGDVKIDMSNADFVHPVTTISLGGVLSDAKITVPRGVKVDDRGLGILGTFKGPRDTVTAVNAATKAPHIIVRGASILSDCKVIVNEHCPELNIVA